ncbi:MAG: type I glyceraldehyde-3-phosphate dehydrogenase [Gemmatimonadales bacterium]|jgi:glyceraldehyde 3-phosphate dehydrogenase
MSKRVAINGFGRIGRLVFRQLIEDEEFSVVAINDIAPLENLAYLLRYDSVHPDPSVAIRPGNDTLHWDDRDIPFLSERNPAEIPWKDVGADLVIEASGIFTRRNEAAEHLTGGADRVIVTAPAKGADLTVCMGVNEDSFDPSKHFVISNASCTTNCLAPVAKVLDEAFGIESGLLTTIHAYTSSQAVVDAPSKKWRRGRAAALSIVPTSTGAAIATTEVLPELEGKLDGMAMRVPVPDGSIIDFVVQTEQPATVDRVNDAFQRASETDRLKGILGVSNEQLVSADVIGSTYSALVDTTSTMVVRDHSVKVLAWYDNEWGYARRVIDLTAYVSQNGSR